ncbi:polymorphic toxin-type HINT domain-containing protein [Streptomyces monticola]|uniref:Polymorphic toxin-type HINT domain-containing protein n=1 Tax=Streptomyces monticola TaxID=2666263 RepID=A0ABW2JBM4_9ACTN
MNGIPGPRPLAVVRRRIALAVTAVMVGTLLQAVTAPVATAEGNDRPGLPASEKPVKGRDGIQAEPRTVTKEPRGPATAPRASWPKARAARVAVPEVALATAGQQVRARGLPLAVGVPTAASSGHPSGGSAKSVAQGEVMARVLDHEDAERAGVNGVLFTLRAGTGKGDRPGKVRARLDYSSFAEAFGGDYADRLTLVQLPACALDTPNVSQCREAKPLPTANDTEKRTLTADTVAVKTSEPTVLAAVAGAQGSGGDFKATSLSPSATWETNLNTGDFTWSYDMPVPDVPGGLKPNLGLSYSSAGIDGRTSATNNQSSWAGDGFDLWPGFIERRYKPCADDGVKHADGNKPGDLCWGYDNAFMTINGQGGELVPAGDDEFKFKKDDGSRIKRLKSTDRGNGDNDGEYWRLTDPQGVRYYFGYQRLPGWTDGKQTTESVWTAPVFGNNSGEPCHAASFADSWCQQAWRWNLDYVVDPRGNAVAYYYDQERNSYGRNLEAKDDTRYTRGGSLSRAEYGLKSSAMYGAKPLAKVDFTTAERCLPTNGVTCAADTIDDKSFYWYDTPWDLNCDAGDDCDQGRYAPAFFTRERLTGVTTQVLRGDTYSKVDSWKLGHRWGQADIDYQLLLDSIQHTGHSAEPAVTLPKTTFAYTQLANRLDKTGDGYAPFIKARLSTIADESGGQIDANYSAPVCDWNALPTPQSNTTRCFPQYIGGSTTDDPERQWFNKYVTTSVTATDRTGGAPDQVTTYEYKGNAAWHYDDDDGLTKEKFKTWSQWRGYGHVRVQTGGQGGQAAMKTQQDSYFLRGMHGDRETTTGGTKDVTVSLGDGEGDPITDHESAAGFTYKTVSYSGPGGKVLAKTVNRPWRHQTAEKKRDWGTVTANFTGTSHSKTWTSLDHGAGSTWRIASKATAYDTTAGRVTQVDDFGDNSTAADNQCARTSYATNADANILTLASRAETVAASCDDAIDRTKDVISDVRTAYDGSAYGAPPTKGDATAVATLKKHDGTTATYLEAGSEFDAYGRQLKATDLTANVTVTGSGTPTRTARTDGRTATTSYSPSTGFAAKVTTTTPPAKAGDASTAQSKSTELDPLRGQPTALVDTNGKRTELTYDALGRNAKVWLPNRLTGQTPSYEFTYFVDEGQPVAVRTQTLNNSGGQIASYTVYDGFLRERQSQSPGPDGGRILADNFYDERGLQAKAFAPYYTEGPPNRALFKPDNALSVESQTRQAFDGLGRVTEAKQIAGNGDGGTVLGTTTTIYGGDRTTVIPPEGATATTTLTDTRGRTTELRQHHSRNVTAAYDTTKYAYTASGKLAKVTDPAGNDWTYTYDQLGRKTKSTDPDKGTTTYTHDDRGLLTTSTDARGTTLANVYDGLDRKTELRKDTPTGELQAKWTYDTLSGAKGQLTQSTRYVNGAAYTSQVTQYDQLYRPIRTAVVIPAAEGALAGTYQTGTAYKLSGVVGAVSYSAAGSLPGGGYSYTYEEQTLRPISLLGNGIQADTSYSLTGKPLQHQLGSSVAGSKKTWATNTYEWGTQRLATSRVERQDKTGVDQHNTYRYDQAGNVLAVTDASRDGIDNQCFTYDYLRRLTEAWTQSDEACTTAPATGSRTGPAPYWNSYTYDKAGNRLTETLHDPTGDNSKDTKRTYAYPDPGQPQPHTLTSVTATGPNGTARDTYGYDKTGNTTTRVLGGDTQTLTWDAEGHLAKVTGPGDDGTAKTTTYLYDTEGNRLIGRTPTETTLYLGHTEVVLPKGATKAKATRYTPLGGGHEAVQADDKAVTITTADHHGTGQLAVNATTLDLSQRRTLPFGGLRGKQPTTWPGTKGFIGGTDDTPATGLTHLGAREYDPTTGRFISVDPIMDLTDPQQIHGYTYSNNNPLTFSDPTGLKLGCGSAQFPEACPKNPETGKPGNGRPGEGVDYTRPAPPHPCNSNCRPKPVSGPGVIYLTAGTVVPTSKNFDYWPGYENIRGDYQAQVMMWSEGLCASDPGSEECRAAHKLGWVKPGGPKELLDVLGVTDAIQCAKGSVGGCLWTTAGLIPFGKVGRAAKLLKSGDRAGAAKLSICPVGNSFTPGTKVLMANGTTKDIEDVKIGDKVLASDPKTGKTTVKTVTAEIKGSGLKRLVEVTIDVDGKKGTDTATVTTTAGHPFWVPELGEWIDATDLKSGQWLRTSAGTQVFVTAIERRTQRAAVYNLTVAGLHTYYVLAGETPVLVHNAGECPTTGFPHGALGESATLQRLQNEGYANITREVMFRNSQGDVFRADFVAQNPSGNWVAVEVKTGRGASLTDNQALGYAELGHGGAVLNTSRVPGLNKGSTVTMKVEVDLWRCPDC